jgi:hypothetical protein
MRPRRPQGKLVNTVGTVMSVWPAARKLDREEAARMVCTTRCGRDGCDWTVTTTVAEGAELFRLHLKNVHGITPPAPPARRRRGRGRY